MGMPRTPHGAGVCRKNAKGKRSSSYSSSSSVAFATTITCRPSPAFLPLGRCHPSVTSTWSHESLKPHSLQSSSSALRCGVAARSFALLGNLAMSTDRSTQRRWNRLRGLPVRASRSSMTISKAWVCSMLTSASSQALSPLLLSSTPSMQTLARPKSKIPTSSTARGAMSSWNLPASSRPSAHRSRPLQRLRSVQASDGSAPVGRNMGSGRDRQIMDTHVSMIGLIMFSRSVFSAGSTRA